MANSLSEQRDRITIRDMEIYDLRFPTSLTLAGSDAMNPDPQYSAAYVILKTDSSEGLEGCGLTFTIGRGNEICTAAIRALKPLVTGLTLGSICSDMRGFWRRITGDSQLRWIGPEKGAIHMATGAVVNAVWDLYAKAANKPLWKLLVDMSCQELVSCIDFRYIRDALDETEAIELLERIKEGRVDREAQMRQEGYPAYLTSVGWIGYSDQKVRQLCQEGLEQGWRRFKIKVGGNIEEDIRRAQIVRQEIGWECELMMDANQTWEVDEAIEKTKRLARFKPVWMEEPTSPDDILGHARIAQAIKPIGVATGEHCHNRIMFKQLMTAGAMRYCQLDSCRLGGVNEVLSVLLMAAKFGIPVCPHGGGVGLCEYIQHLSLFDYICVSGSLQGRCLEYVDHLHEHFVDPCLIRKGHYLPPTKPGYSITMKPGTLEKYTFKGDR